MNEHSLSTWAKFWHVPLRAERLAITRIFFGVAILSDQLFQYLPRFTEFFGPYSVAPAGVNDKWLLENWYWTVWLFGTDDLTILYSVFFLWVFCTLSFTVGWHTRLSNVAVWFLTMAFSQRNPNILNGGDKTLIVGLFLLMLSPSGYAFSLDSWRRRRRTQPQRQGNSLTSSGGLAWTPAWPVRIIQIQLCVIYLTTGLAKLGGNCHFEGNRLHLEGTWWDGTSIHYALNYVTMSRWSFAQLPLPYWLTAIMTYVSVTWEVLFPVLVLSKWTRKWALWFGVLFHLGIYLTIEVGWFSFYTLCLYGVWIPGEFWDRFFRPSTNSATTQSNEPVTG